jgi:hypothetical protein
MNMKKPFFIALICLFAACNSNVEKLYYDTGELHATREKIDDREYDVQVYSKKGYVILEGIVRDSLREGQWNYYYSDGVLRGELIYSQDKMIAENIRYPIILDFKDNPSEFKINNTYQFRILGVGVFFHTQTHEKLNLRQVAAEVINDVSYWLEITPQRAGNDTIMVVITGFEEGINPGSIDINTDLQTIDKDTALFPIKVVD